MGWVRCSGGLESGAWMPYSLDRDIWNGIQSNKVNVTWAFSDWQDEFEGNTSFIKFFCRTASGYEGVCFTFPSAYNLVSGTSYNLKFTFTSPSGIAITASSYNWGCKWTNSAISGFNTPIDLAFERLVDQSQDITFNFTADSNNYFSIILSALSSGSGVFTVSNIRIEEVT